MDIDGSLLVGIIMLVAVVGVPIYQAFLAKASATKEQNDQFHKRINEFNHDNWETKVKTSYLEGYNQGVKDGKAEAREEL